MNPEVTQLERWASIERLYHEALALDPHARDAFLDRECAGEDALRAEVRSLLDHDGGSAFLDRPAVVMPTGPGIPIGATIGPYVVAEQIGEGGMGEVYRARDTKLRRDVAIKIVPLAFIADSDRLARFEREARMLAALNHPHIGAIYGVEESPGMRALVLEFVEGDTLAEQLAAASGRGEGLPISRAISIARQIADALEAAHERGIVHRDLKPANIKITSAGQVKVLDFGLAKAVGADPAAPQPLEDASLSAVAITGGLIVGTAAYMSPEQARGQPVDKRTDIWAFGCVLYEMLTGRAAFAGATITDTIAAVLTGKPDWSTIPRTTPPYLLQLLKRCLEKDATRRLRDIGDARIELDTAEEIVIADPDARSAPWGQRWRTVAIGVGIVGIVATAFGTGALMRPPLPADAMPVRFSVFPPAGNRFYHTVASTFPALSPDGSQLALIVLAPQEPPAIWLRPISGLEARRVPGTEGARSIFWSPDGRSLGFFAGPYLKRIDLQRGAAVLVCSVPSVASFGTWSSDGTILFASMVGDGIFSVSSAGGVPESIVTPDTAHDEQVVWPSFLPDGKRFVYLSQRSNSTGYLMLGERGHASRQIVSALSNVQWVDPDYLVYAQEGVLVAQRFDLVKGQSVGPPISIADSVDQFLSTGRAMFTTSRNGTIAYHSYANVSRLAWIDRTGKELDTVAGPGNYMTVRLSPDAGTALFPRTRPGIGTWDLYTVDLARQVETRVTSDSGSEAYPVWMPDGRAILFADGRHGGTLNLARKNFDTGAEDQLLPSGSQRRPIDVHGETVLFTELSPVGTLDIWMLALSDPAARSQLFGSRFHEADPRFSPDGRAMAFTSDESGRFQVYVAPFPTTGGKIQISSGMYPGVDGQQGARWSRDGRELFYVSADRRLMSIPVRTTPRLEVGSPTALFEMGGRAWEDFDVSTDGKRFLAVLPQALAGEQPLTVVVNWAADVHR